MIFALQLLKRLGNCLNMDFCFRNRFNVAMKTV